ncbi:MAG: segregation/condensation protein A [Bdellovibrionota bacterium]
MLLPPDENQDDPEDEGKDPREELVKRLLEYQKYKTAAEHLKPFFYWDKMFSFKKKPEKFMHKSNLWSWRRLAFTN